MKIRNGFVSNSSSSSFCVIGTTWRSDELAKKDGVKDDDFGYGLAEGKVLEYHGAGLSDEWGGELTAGLNAEHLLETMTIPQAKEHVRDVIKKKLKMDIPIDKIGFHFGEAGND